MFYVFYLNDGYMLVLDDIAPTGYFRDLYQEITPKTGVQPRDQVFFLSSGEALVGDYLLADYVDAGTEANPIYFIKRISTEKDPINSREQEGIKSIFDNWKRDVEQLHSLPIKPTLVENYIEAGNAGIRVADTLFRYCAKIVAEHQYLNHGWTAVTRNLDENVASISNRYGRVYRISQRLPQIRRHAQNWVLNFDVVFDALSKIKIPISLLTINQTGSSDSDAENTADQMTLLEWIERQDPLHTLDSLIEHVSHHIEKLDDNDVKQANDALKIVKELIKRKDYREIKGIDKRLAMLDAKLVELETVYSKLKESTMKLLQVQSDPNTYRTVVGEQRDRINNLSISLEEFTHHAYLFLNSKLELLKNVRQRLAGWIRQSYDRLSSAQRDVTLFEEKFNGFRQRLDLVRQIREAPILFVAAVGEVIRRNAFHAEFNEWLLIFIQKCSDFIKDENTTRAEFFVKLEKHFLRDIFKGMGDELPNFCPTKIKFDTKLPNVNDDMLRELREALKECANMENHFTIVYPQVFNRLMVTPKAQQQSESREQQTYFHREESFFVRDKSINPMHSNFPSSNWLSEDHPEMSPVNNQFFISKTGSTTSLNVDSNVTTPSDLVPNLESIQPINSIPRAMVDTSPSSVDLTSPTSIHPEHYSAKSDKPERLSRPLFQAGDDSEINDGTETSSSTTPMYTPLLSTKKIEESQQTCVLQDSTLTLQDNEVFKEIKPRLAEITEELKGLKSDANESRAQLGELFEKNMNSILEEASNQLKATQLSLSEQIQTNNNMEERLMESEAKMAEMAKKIEKLESENGSLKEIVEHEKYLRVEKEKEIFTLSETTKKLNDDLLNTIQDKNQLQIELLTSESDRKKLEERIETDSNASDYLSIELDILSQILKRELQTDEIEFIRSEIDKRKNVKKTDQEANIQQEHGSNSRAEYENVLRKKMTLLVQGMEERKNEEIAKLRDSIESEIKEENNRFVRKLRERIGELEDKLQFYEIVGPTTSRALSPIPAINQSMLCSFTSAAMHESCQVIKEDEEKVEEEDPIDPAENDKTERVIEQAKDDEDEDLAIVNVTRTSVSTQTKLRMRDLRMMVSLNEISEGWAVILVYSEIHNSYCVLSMTSLLYFVKRRSLLSIGIEQDNRPAKNKLIFARVVSVELCETKKAPNRYNLPPSTRFYRVDVSPMSLTGLPAFLSANVEIQMNAVESSSTKTV